MNNITISTELMKNYKQAEIMSPEKKFEALQTDSGCSLLFSIGSDGAFYITEETEGHGTGWQKSNLSAAAIAAAFPGEQGVVCKTFDAAQSAVDGSIGLAMVVTDSNGDHLFLCLGNSNSDTAWTQAPVWKQVPFDAPAKTISVVDVFLSETADNKQYILVDILKDPSNSDKLISRYYVDPQSAPHWRPHLNSVAIEAGTYHSCLGRQYFPNAGHQPPIDGVYTAGQAGGHSQIVFQSLYNFLNPRVAPSPYLLNLPGGVIAEAIASCRKSDLSTDVYATSGSGLYYFASSNQLNGATAVLLFENDIFSKVRKLYSHQTSDTVIVWGLNGLNEVFYTSCLTGEETDATKWSYPVPILTGVDIFSPYLNRLDNGNTFFGAAGDTLQKLVKSPETSIWASQSITLPSTDTEDTNKYSSYTTRIQVTDDNNQPLAKTSVKITANTRTGVYINHLYYVVDNEGVEIDTDELGSITIVEWVDSLNGTKLNVSLDGGEATAVDPTAKPFQQIAGLNTPDSLQKAVITDPMTGATRPFISSASSGDLQAAAAANANLATAYDSFLSPTQPMVLVPATVAAVGVPVALTTDGGIFHSILVDAGNIFHWLKSGVEAVVHIVKEAVTDAWHFVVEIAGKTFHAILDAVEKVVGAIAWVFEKIGAGIEDVIKFAEFLFRWDDILNTHKVMKNMIIQTVGHSLNSMSTLEADVRSIFASMKADVDRWAGVPDFADSPNSTTKTHASPEGQHSAPAQLGMHHFQGNAQNATSTVDPATAPDDLLNNLSTLAGGAQGNTLTSSADDFHTNVVGGFHKRSIKDTIDLIIEKLADDLLDAVKDVLIAAIDLVISLKDKIMELLDHPIHIPVISYLYKEITHGEELSFLDLICLISAIPVTVVYKIVSKGQTPFPANDPFTTGLIGAKSFDELQAQFWTVPGPAAGLERAGIPMAGATPVLDETKLKIFGFTTGMIASCGAGVLLIATGLQRLTTNRSPRLVSLMAAIGNVAYVSPNIATLINIKTGNWYQQMNNSLTMISIGKGFINMFFARLPNKSKWVIASAAVETSINTLWNVPVIMNIIDNKSRWNTDYKSLIVESIGNFAFNLGGMLELPILIADIKQKIDPELGMILTQWALMYIYGLCMPIAGGIYEFAPGQNHGDVVT